MGFRIENDLAEIQGARRREEHIEIFECLGQREALHFVVLLHPRALAEFGCWTPGAALTNN